MFDIGHYKLVSSQCCCYDGNYLANKAESESVVHRGAVKSNSSFSAGTGIY